MTRRKLLLAALSLTLLSLPTLPAHAQNDGDPYVDIVAQGKGRINYAAGLVKATGYGAPPTSSQNPAQARLMAMGAAKADALRNLAMAVSSIQVTATTKVKNYVTESDTVETKVSAILQNARITSETLGKDGMASVTVEIPMYGKGSVASAVMAEAIMEPLRELEARRELKPEPRDSFKEPRGGAKPIKVEPRIPRPSPKTTTCPLRPLSRKAPSPQ